MKIKKIYSWALKHFLIVILAVEWLVIIYKGIGLSLTTDQIGGELGRITARFTPIIIGWYVGKSFWDSRKKNKEKEKR